jgi:thioredoxin-like negative regulator of GroEL
MIERVLFALGLIALGVLAYKVVQWTQRAVAVRAVGRAEAQGRPALLIFTSPTCAPCKLQQMPIVERLTVEWGERVDLRVIDVSEDRFTAAHYGVWCLPTTIVLDGSGQVEAIHQGVAGEQKLREQIGRLIHQPNASGAIAPVVS